MCPILNMGRKETDADVPGTSERHPSGAVVVHCRGCDRKPSVTDQTCIRCMVAAVSLQGDADRIRMSGGRDVEVTGRTARTVCLMSRLLSSPVEDPDRPKCSDCPRRPTLVLDAAMQDFPEPSFQRARVLTLKRPDDEPECAACVQMSSSIITASEEVMDRIREVVCSEEEGE